MMKTKILFILFFLSIIKYSNAQDNIANSNYYYTGAFVYSHDTVPHYDLREIIVFPTRYGSYNDFKNQQKLIRNVKKVYPYAKLAKLKLIEINDTLLTMNSKKQQKEYINKMDDILQDQFGDELKKLSISQGRILIRLIDRETGDTTYELVKDLKGRFTVFFWQALAVLYGSSMKTTYDPSKGEDKMIEQILVLIENGQL